MKKRFIFIITLLLCTFLCGCSSSIISFGKPIELSHFDIVEVSALSDDRIIYDSLADRQEHLRLDYNIVFRGKLDGKRIAYADESGEGFPDFTYFETPIRVLEVFYGDVQTNDIVLLCEDFFIGINENKEEFLGCYENRPFIEEGKEYLFILNNMPNLPANNGEKLYCSEQSIYAITDYDTFKQEAHSGNSDAKIGLEAIDYYINQDTPDLQVDVEKETQKMIQANGKDAIVLTEEQQTLLNNMVEQYGEKNNNA